jgi:EAL domain-containing protein (putative c-di-GMP-specific phosphodiesterase class I)
MPSLFAAANMDPTFILDDRFVDVVMSVLADTGVRPQQVLLDINANVAGAQINMLWPRLASLKTHGVGIALEDYGIGLGSADLLRRCRFDVIRLPRSLVGGLGLADEDRLIVNGIVNLAHSLGYYVVAEGVETAEQVRLLRSAKCDLLQGFIIGKPVQDTDVTKNLDELRRTAKAVSEL